MLQSLHEERQRRQRSAAAPLVSSTWHPLLQVLEVQGFHTRSFLNAKDACQLQSVCRGTFAAWQSACVSHKKVGPGQGLFYWGRLEGSTRARGHVTIQENTLWGPAFTPLKEEHVACGSQPCRASSTVGAAAAVSQHSESGPPQQYTFSLLGAARLISSWFAHAARPWHLPAVETGIHGMLTPEAREAFKSIRTSSMFSGNTINMWGLLLIAILLSGNGYGARELARWLWKHSAAGCSLGLCRYTVREFLCCVCMLLRHREMPKHAAVSARAVHDALCMELQALESRDNHQASRFIQQVPEWQSWSLPPPSNKVRLPPAVYLTHEQITIIQNVIPFSTDPHTEQIVYDRPFPDCVQKVQAFAGTGKTTTLFSLVQAHPEVTFLYTAFNRSLVMDAKEKFRNMCNVEALTTHQLAGSKFREYQHVRPIESLTSGAIASLLKQHLGLKWLDYSIVKLVEDGLNRYMTSDDAIISDKHIDQGDLTSLRARRPNLKVDLDDLVDMVKHVWSRVIDKDETKLPIPHNAYLKLFVLENPKLKAKNGRPYDVILVDEAQDINAVTMQLLLAQPGIKVLVGDRHQHIYSFNYCCDAMCKEYPNAGREFSLTASFRLGPWVADVANAVLRDVLGESRMLLGQGMTEASIYIPSCDPANTKKVVIDPRANKCEIIEYVEGFHLWSDDNGMQALGAPEYLRCIPVEASGVALLPQAPCMPPRQLVYVTRKNVTWFLAAVELAAKGLSFYCAATGKNGNLELCNLLLQLHDFKTKNQRRGRLLQFDSWVDMLQHLETGVDQDLRLAAKFVEAHGDRIPKMVEDVDSKRCRDPDDALYILTTAHRVKGLEHKYVQVADDFVQVTELAELRCCRAQAPAIASDIKPEPAGPSTPVKPQSTANASTPTSSHMPSQQPGSASKGTVAVAKKSEPDEENLVYEAVTRAQRVLILNKDLAKLMASQGQRGWNAVVRVRTLQALQLAPKPVVSSQSSSQGSRCLNSSSLQQLEQQQYSCACSASFVPLQGATMDVHLRATSTRLHLACQHCAQATLFSDVPAAMHRAAGTG